MNCPILTGLIIDKSSQIYNESRLNYNLSINKYPNIIVYCFNDTDVINALKYCKYYDIHFRVRTTGHDFEANSNMDFGLVIDLSNMNNIDIDESELQVTIGGGCTFGQVYENLVTHGYTVPAGTCSGVGACGLTTVGGVGYATRYLGLTIDNLIEVTLINKDFNTLTVNKENNFDLFWAIKGAPGSNFGVITSLKYKITPVNKATFFTSSFNQNSSVDIMNIFQNLAPTTDSRLTLNLTLSKLENNSIALTLSGQFFGDIPELIPLIQPFFDASKPIETKMYYVDYEETINMWAQDCYPPNMFKNSGAFIYELIPTDNLEDLLKFVENAPDGFLHYLEFLPLGGNVLNVDSNHSSFAHRDALCLIQIKAIWNTPTEEYESKLWSNNLKKYLDTICIGNYRGFTDFNIIDWQYQYYMNNYTKLQIIKTKYDPHNFFKSPQGVQVID